MNTINKNIFWNRFLVILSLILIGSGFIFDTPIDLIQGLVKILKFNNLAPVDNMAVGSIGSALTNAGLSTLIGILIIKIMYAPFNGLSISACMTITGYALLGKNPYNIIFPIIGAITFLKLNKFSLREYAPLVLATSGLCPIVGYISFISESFILGPLLGFLAGFILPSLSLDIISNHPEIFHLRNGLAVGIIGSIIASSLIFFNINLNHLENSLDFTDLRLVIIVYILCFILLLPKIIYNRDFSDYKNLISSNSSLSLSFTEEYNPYTILFNMGILGIIGTTFIILTNSNLNGMTLGAIITMMGFGALMLDPKSALYIILGVFISGYLGKYEVNSDLLASATLFGTSLAPIVRRYGKFKGLLAGFLHGILVTQLPSIHHGLILYNNSFSTAIIAIILVPFYDILSKKMK